MKNIKLVIPAKSQSEMNALIENVCSIMGQDPKMLRDKFKMIDIPHPKKIMDLCEHLKLDVTFRNSGEEPLIAVELIGVPDNFTLEDVKPPAETPEEESVKEEAQTPEDVFESEEITSPEDILDSISSDTNSDLGNSMANDGDFTEEDTENKTDPSSEEPVEDDDIPF